jgi:hypothetical protein
MVDQCAQQETKGALTMAARHTGSVRWASVLLWVGRVIAAGWAIIFLLSLIGEVANGYQPGGSAFTSVLLFAEGALMLAGVALSFWRAWVGGAVLIMVWAASSLALALGLEPQADVAYGLAAGAVIELLPGLILVAASMIQHQNARAVAA